MKTYEIQATMLVMFKGNPTKREACKFVTDRINEPFGFSDKMKPNITKCKVLRELSYEKKKIKVKSV